MLCAQRGYICPIEDLDVVVSLESDFVVMQTDGKYTFIPNVDRERSSFLIEVLQQGGELGRKRIGL